MNYLYGILLVMLGFLIIAPHIFKVRIPIFAASTAVIIVFIGVTLFTHGPGLGSDNDIVFSTKTVQVTNPAKEYDLTFSGSTIDLSNVLPQYKG
ncbi:hypothetical protein L7E55_08575 [Pelotomaculum isophthalicicum JI]|uniref:Uncharacterized protein n=1 Tax=Pelotomaculum isophthalicicum JI TaxID=947010 RepID=A0A9X4JVI8_9FIRM|nr:hypothetical protein [Pelotomaculum isophthalicicum]MDF9408411.1 hypothetical protein [Pelotomaculum isophthalicicum JI]